MRFAACGRKHFQGESAELQIPPLRYPGFPVELDGVDALHAPFFTEGRTRGLVQRSVAGKSGYAPVGMTKVRVALSVGMDLWMKEQQVPAVSLLPV
jgi:hypothetical protein